MPSLIHNDVSLYYEDSGSGPAVVLLHPLTADAKVWSAIGISDELRDAGFRVLTLDAVGHGRSGEAYGERVSLRNRVADVLAAADEAGLKKFHCVGYSMGAWIGTGLVQIAPKRLLSAALAGWDPVDGARRFTELSDMSDRRTEFESTILALNGRTPHRTAPSIERMRGYADTYERLFIDIPSITTLITSDFPIMLAAGVDDPYYDTVALAADALDTSFLDLPGDHIAALLSPVYRTGLIAWLKKASSIAETGI